VNKYNKDNHKESIIMPGNDLKELIYLRPASKTLKLYPTGKKNILDIINDVTQSRSKFTNTSMIDRTGSFQYKMKMKIENPLPTDFNTSISFAECCTERALDLLNTGKNITISWSGGIDSTVVLVSFLSAVSGTPDESRIKVLLTQKSIEEYPLFYEKYIKDKLNSFMLVNKHLSKYLVDENEFLVTGDPGDYLIGRTTDITHKNKTFEQWFNHQIEAVDYLADNPTLKSDIYEKISGFINDTCPYPVNNAFDAVKWLKLSLSWEQGMNRIYKFAMYDKTNIINRKGFFNTQNFQRWAISNHDNIVGDTPLTYKYIMKDYIYEFTKDSEYRSNKIKIGSARLENFNDTTFRTKQDLKSYRDDSLCTIMIDSTYRSYTRKEIFGSEQICIEKKQLVMDNLVLPNEHPDWIQI